MGNAAIGAPALAALDDWYVLEQIDAYTTGRRGTHKDDTQGAQMRAAAVTLNSKQARRDVVAYIATLAAGAGESNH